MSTTQVLIAGGGPAGAVAGATLARAGVQCTLMERVRFPRYHIGESLLPSVLTILEAIGLRETIENHGFVKKYGGLFRWGPDSNPWKLAFGELEGRQNYAFQVIRSEFDDLLLRHAAASGVRVLEETVVRDVEFSADGRAHGATYRTGDREGHITFDFLIDASGRYGLMANHHLNSRIFHPAFDNIAVWRYWRGGKPTPRVQGGIITEATPLGWIWYIPLHDLTTSVGAVMSRRTTLMGRAVEPEAAYEAVIASSRVVSNQLEHATIASDVRVERDYSYHADSFAGPGYFMAGDAACFIDPVLSSGVHLATMSGLMAGACIQSVLLDGFDELDARRFYEHSYRTAFHRFLAFLSAFYDQNRHVHSYFWERRGLTERDCSVDALRHAFVRLVTGTQDFIELTRSASTHSAVESLVSARIAENIELRNSNVDPGPEAERSHRFVSSVEGLFPCEIDEAVNGAVLELFPRVRLRAVSPRPQAAK